MKNYKVIVLYILILAFVGCGVKKRSFESVSKESKEITVKTEQVKAPVLNQALFIEQPCDSVEIIVEGKTYKAPGKSKDFKYSFAIDSLKAEIELKNNQFFVNMDAASKIIKDQRSEIIDLKTELKESKEVQVPYVPKWVYWVIIVLLVGWVFPGIPKKLRGLIGFPI